VWAAKINGTDLNRAEVLNERHANAISAAQKRHSQAVFFHRSKKFVSLAVIMSFLSSACAVDPMVRMREGIESWLERSPRRISINLASSPSRTYFHAEEYHKVTTAGEGAARGALGGLQGGMQGVFQTHDPMGAAIMVFLVPVFIAVGAVGGGVYGAVATTRTVTPVSLEKVPHGPDLMKAIRQAPTFKAELEAVLKNWGKSASEHQLFLFSERSDNRGPGQQADAKLLVYIDTFGLMGELQGEDPMVRLVFEGSTDLQTNEGRAAPQWSTFLFKSRSYSLSEWAANEGSLYKRIVLEATKAMVEQIAASMNRETGAWSTDDAYGEGCNLLRSEAYNCR
jgi:hypothetical protein